MEMPAWKGRDRHGISPFGASIERVDGRPVMVDGVTSDAPFEVKGVKGASRSRASVLENATVRETCSRGDGRRRAVRDAIERIGGRRERWSARPNGARGRCACGDDGNASTVRFPRTLLFFAALERGRGRAHG